MRTLLLALVLAAPALAAPSARAQDSTAYGADFDAMWTFVAEEYAYPERSAADWPAVRALYRPVAAAAPSRRAFVTVLERALAELGDAHAHLGTNTADSPRLVPSGADVWAEWQNGAAVLTSVRARSGAELAGLRVGDTVETVDGQPVRDAAEARLPRTRRAGDTRADAWALVAALAGTHGRPVRVGVDTVLDIGAFVLAFTPGETPLPPGLVVARVEAGDVGVIRILNSLGESATVAAFDSVLTDLRGTRGLILDLRDTPGGGNTTVARGILGRFVARTLPYQRHDLPAEMRRTGVARAWLELVAPRGPFTYAAPVVVLVGRWTGSMGEGLAIGFDGTDRARVVGTPMAGLLGALGELRLPNTGIAVRIPTERLAHVRGTPREAFVPFAAPSALGRDAALDAALRLLGEGGRPSAGPPAGADG